ncbi:hypothetical protein [Streptomyces sp. NPDC046821]|uniref:hypothetical protein n=1 Tax=Streptomyces sp. NPDC046821 TaxID=3154702 RepID=UPI0033D926FF
MKKIKAWTAMALPALMASAAVYAAPSATAAPERTTLTSVGAISPTALTCDFRPGLKVTNKRTPVHTGPSGKAPVTQYFAAGRKVNTYYECINSAGNLWYEITGKLDNGGSINGRFIYSGYLS